MTDSPIPAAPEGVSEAEEAAATGPPRRGSSCLGCLARSGLGCFAFLIGAVTAAILFGPSVLRGPAKELLENNINRRIAGEIEIDHLRLAWAGSQRAVVRVNDEQGSRIGTYDVRVPGMLDLFNPSKHKFFAIEPEEGQARIEFDEDGSCDLVRALEGIDARSWWSYFHAGGRGSYTVQVDVAYLTVAGIGSEEVHLHNADFLLDRRAFGYDDIWFECEPVHPCTGRVNFKTSYAGALDPDQDRPWESIMVHVLSGQVNLDGLSVWQEDLPPEWGPWIGDRLNYSISIAENGQYLLREGVAEGVHLAGTIDRSSMTLEDDAFASVPIPVALLDRLAGLPADLALHGDPLPVTFQGSGLILPVGRKLEIPTVAKFWEETRGVLTVESDETIEVHGADAQHLESWHKPRVSIAFGEERTQLEATSGQRQSHGFDAMLLGEWSRSESGEPTWSLELNALGEGIPLLDHFGPGDGTLSGWFDPDGTRVSLEGTDSGGLRLELEDLGASLSGEIQDGRLVGESGVEASLVLAGSDRWLQRLLPWMGEIKQLEGRAKLHLTEYSLPVDGSLVEAQAQGRLEFGLVQHRLSAGLAELLGVEEGVSEQKLPAIRFTLDRGIVTFHELVLCPAGMEPVDVIGTYDLVTGRIDFAAELPLSVALDVEPVEGLDTYVDVGFTGSWDKPVKQVDTRALRQIRALIEGLGD